MSGSPTKAPGFAGGYLLDRVFIPPEVLTELIGDGRFGLRYLEYHHIDTLVEVVEAPAPPVEILTLDDGEQAAISFALKREVPLLI